MLDITKQCERKGRRLDVILHKTAAAGRGGGPGACGEERRHLAEELAEASLEGLTDAVHDLSGSAAGTLQDVAGCRRDAVFVGLSVCWFDV